MLSHPLSDVTLRKSPEKQVGDGTVNLNLQTVVCCQRSDREELRQEDVSYVPSPILLWGELRNGEISRK